MKLTKLSSIDHTIGDSVPNITLRGLMHLTNLTKLPDNVESFINENLIKIIPNFPLMKHECLHEFEHFEEF